MALSYAGVVPVSGLNLGLVASIGGLNVQIEQLSSRVVELTTALAAQLQVSASFPPNPAAYAAAITGHLNVTNMTLALSAMSVNGASISTELGVKLGLVNGRIAVVSAITAPFAAGLAAPGLSGWCYSGSARGLGRTLEQATAGGFGRTAPETDVQAVIIAAESQSSWSSFGDGFHVGGTDQAPADPGNDSLRYQGELGGGQWNIGCAELVARLRLLLDELEGQASALEASIDVAAGIGLPSATALVNAGLDIVADVGVTGLLDNLVNVQTDITAGIASLNAQIALVTSLIGDINAQLSAGGFRLWFYDGRAGDLGAALRAELEGGLPGGAGPMAPAYGVVLAGSPAAMAMFGAIFKTS